MALIAVPLDLISFFTKKKKKWNLWNSHESTFNCHFCSNFKTKIILNNDNTSVIGKAASSIAYRVKKGKQCSVSIEQTATETVYKHTENPPHYLQHLVMCWSVFQQPCQIVRGSASSSQLCRASSPAYKGFGMARSISQWESTCLEGGRPLGSIFTTVQGQSMKRIRGHKSSKKQNHKPNSAKSTVYVEEMMVV